MADHFNILDTPPGLSLIPAYTTYVPTLTATSVNPTMGTGSTTYGYYGQVGKRVFGYAGITFGTTAAAGTGIYGFLLPVTPADRVQPIGTGYLIDVSDSTRPLLGAASVTTGVFAAATKKCVIIISSPAGDGFADGNNPIGAAVPWTWADTDQINIQFDYEAA